MVFENPHRSIERELTEVEDVIRKQLRHVSQDEELLADVFDAFFRGGGKKLRPRLVILSAFALRQGNLREIGRSEDYRALIHLAAVVELIHSASLMHDDVLDHADSRRGNPSLNSRFGNKIAILAGDILYSYAFELLIAEADMDTALQLTQCVRRMCRGEVTNLTDHDFDGYKTIIEDKTASLMHFCCSAAAAKVRRDDDSPHVVEAIGRFGYCFGMAYQLTDDLCDHDSMTVITDRPQVLALLQEHIRAAEQALLAVPDSVYKDNLAGLLHYIVSKSEKMDIRDVVQAELVQAGPGSEKGYC